MLNHALRKAHPGRPRTIALALSATALAGAGFLAVAPAASAQTLGGCGTSQSPTVSGGRAHWTVNCSGGNVTLAGTVTDTASDGKCATVTAQFPSTGNTYTSRKACPSGQTQSYSWTNPGYGADGYLKVT